MRPLCPLTNPSLLTADQVSLSFIRGWMFPTLLKWSLTWWYMLKIAKLGDQLVTQTGHRLPMSGEIRHLQKTGNMVPTWPASERWGRLWRGEGGPRAESNVSRTRKEEWYSIICKDKRDTLRKEGKWSVTLAGWRILCLNGAFSKGTEVRMATSAERGVSCRLQEND